MSYGPWFRQALINSRQETHLIHRQPNLSIESLTLLNALITEEVKRLDAKQENTLASLVEALAPLAPAEVQEKAKSFLATFKKDTGNALMKNSHKAMLLKAQREIELEVIQHSKG
jgi:hypothetical protein